ncbi:hypothetical protein ABPG74_001698 [Tetrahymena malaccensis]
MQQNEQLVYKQDNQDSLIKQQAEIFQVSKSDYKEDSVFLKQAISVQNDNFMFEPNPGELNSHKDNKRQEIQQQKYKKNIAKLNQLEQIQDIHNEEQYSFNGHIQLLSPTSNIFKSDEDLFSQKSLPQNIKRESQNVINRQKQPTENDHFNENNQKNEDLIIIPTNNQNENQIQDSQQMCISQEAHHFNDKTIEDDYNQLSTPNNYFTQTAYKETKESEDLLQNKEESQSQIQTRKQMLQKLKISLDKIIPKNSNSIDSKKSESQEEKITQSNPALKQEKEQSSNKQSNFSRKLTNAQSVNLSQTKAKKFFPRKSEFGLIRQQFNSENPLEDSLQVEQIKKDQKDKQVQMQIIEKFQQKNWKIGIKAQRSESMISCTQLDQKQNEQKTWDIVNKLCILLKAKHKLRNLIKQRFSALSLYERGLIGDHSDGKLISQKTITDRSKIYQKIMKFSIHPGSFPIIIFKIYLLLITMINLVYLPLMLGFDLEVAHFSYAFFFLTAVSYSLEIAIKFKTSLSEKGEIITNPSLIAKKYIQNELLYDIITLLGIILGSAQHIFFLLMIIRIKHILKYMDDLNNHYYLAEKYHQLWVLSGLFCFIVMIVHYFACIFHYVGLYQIDDKVEISWINYYQLQNTAWQIRYNYSLYFSFITTATIGYGDLTPQNTSERSVVIVYSIVASMCFSYTVNTVGNVFQDYFNKYQKQFIMRYNAINFMSNRSIGKELQLRVLKYIEYIHDLENDSPDKGFAVINQISKNLKSQIYNEYYGKILMQDKSFSLNFSKESIQKLSLRIQEKLYGPGEIIFEQEEQDYRLYYLMKGECEFYYYNKGGSKQSEYKTIQFSSDKKFFGYKGFFSGIPREFSCRSTNISHVFIITRQDLIEVLKEDPEDYEQFCKLRDQFLLYRNSLGEQCFGCKHFGHTLSGCPQIHLIKNKELLILRHNFSVNQKRMRRLRKKHKYKALSLKQEVSSSAQQYRLDTVNELKKINKTENEQLNQDFVMKAELSDKRFSKMYPYIKFKSDEMILFDNYEDVSDFSDSGSEDSQSSSSSKSLSIEAISEQVAEENEDQSGSEDLNEEKNKNNKNIEIKNVNSFESLTSDSEDTPNRQSKASIQSVSQIDSDKKISNGLIKSSAMMLQEDIFQNKFDKPNQEETQTDDTRQHQTISEVNDKPIQNIPIETRQSIHRSSASTQISRNVGLQKNTQEHNQQNGQFQRLSKVKINSKTIVQPSFSKQNSMKESRGYIESPSISRQSSKRMTDFQRKSTNLKKKFSRIENNLQLYQEEPEFLIKDFAFNNDSSSSLPINFNPKIFRSHSLSKQNTDGVKFSKQLIENNQNKKDSILRIYEKQVQYLQGVVLKLVQKEQNKEKTIYSQNNVQYQENEPQQQESNKACMKMNYNNLSMEMPFALKKSSMNYTQNFNILQQTTMDVNYEINNQVNELFNYDFDDLKEFTKYFPHNNASQVCLGFKQYQDRRKKIEKLFFQKLRINKLDHLNNISKILTPNNKR